MCIASGGNVNSRKVAILMSLMDCFFWICKRGDEFIAMCRIRGNFPSCVCSVFSSIFKQNPFFKHFSFRFIPCRMAEVNSSELQFRLFFPFVFPHSLFLFFLFSFLFNFSDCFFFSAISKFLMRRGPFRKSFASIFRGISGTL